MRTQTTLVALALILTSTPALATTYGGNPVLTVGADFTGETLTDGAVTLDKVVLHHCLGGTSIWNTDVDIDPVAGWSMDMPAGDHCSVDFVWSTTMELNGQGFAIDYDEASTSVTLVGADQQSDLTPFTLVSGVIHGGNPSLTVHIQ